MELRIGDQQVLEKALQMLHDASRDELVEKKDIPGEKAAVVDCIATIRRIYEISSINELEVDVDFDTLEEAEKSRS